MTGDAAGIGGITPAIAAECLEGGFVGESSEVTGPGRFWASSDSGGSSTRDCTPTLRDR